MCDFGATLDTEIKHRIILATNNNKLRRYCFRKQDVTLQQLLLHAKSFGDAESQTIEIEKMTENVVGVTLTRQRQPLQLTRFSKNTQKEGKSSHNSSKICFQCGRNQPHSRYSPVKGEQKGNTKKKVILKDAADQRHGLRGKKPLRIK